jgi:hypothetical protein
MKTVTIAATLAFLAAFNSRAFLQEKSHEPSLQQAEWG